TGRLYRYAQSIPHVKVVEQWYTSRIQKMAPEVGRLRQHIKAARYDLIHINGSADHRHVMFACLGMAKRPALVWTKHNDHQVSSLGNRLRARLGTDHVIAVSDYVKGML